MQFRIQTLLASVALIALTIAIGKEIGLIPVMVTLCVAGFFVPAFIPNFWLRVAVAAVMTGLPLGTVRGLIIVALTVEGQPSFYEVFVKPVPVLLAIGAAAVAFSSLLRWGSRQYLDYRATLQWVEKEVGQETKSQ